MVAPPAVEGSPALCAYVKMRACSELSVCVSPYGPAFLQHGARTLMACLWCVCGRVSSARPDDAEGGRRTLPTSRR